MRGKTATVGDVVRVGRVLVELGLLDSDREPSDLGKRVLLWAHLGGAGAREPQLHNMTRRLVRALRREGLVPVPNPTPIVAAYSSLETDAGHDRPMRFVVPASDFS